jgi:rRNA maturation protein Nop10
VSEKDDRLLLDTRGLPSRGCLQCGGDTFKVLIRLDEDNSIAWYTLNGYCAECGAAVTIPTPDGDEL